MKDTHTTYMFDGIGFISKTIEISENQIQTSFHSDHGFPNSFKMNPAHRFFQNNEGRVIKIVQIPYIYSEDSDLSAEDSFKIISSQDNPPFFNNQKDAEDFFKKQEAIKKIKEGFDVIFGDLGITPKVIKQKKHGNSTIFDFFIDNQRIAFGISKEY